MKVDLFADKLIDETTRSTAGSIFSLVVLPLTIAGTLAFQTVRLWTRPPSVSMSTSISTDLVRPVTLMCLAPGGCYFTQNYESLESESCKARMVMDGTYDTYAKKCTKIKYKETVEASFCYTSEPLDGPKMIWRRDQSCEAHIKDGEVKFGVSTDNKLISLNVNSSISVTNTAKYAFENCTRGVAGKTYFMTMDKKEGPKVETKWMTFAKGIHLLSFTNTTYRPVLGSNMNLIEISSVITSTESLIASTNICCGDSEVATTCYNDNGYGKANDRYVNGQFYSGDYYQLMIRMFPTYNVREIEEINISLELFNLAGSVYTVIFWFCLIIVTSIRWVCTIKQPSHKSVV